MKINVRLEVGKVYKLASGRPYKVLSVSDDNSAVVVNTRSGWCCCAHNICLYDDGTIEWDYSTNGYFLDEEKEQTVKITITGTQKEVADVIHTIQSQPNAPKDILYELFCNDGYLKRISEYRKIIRERYNHLIESGLLKRR